MGEVYRARDTRLNRTVAIKVLARHLADRAGVSERFEREARAIASLNHPHICVLYDVGHEGDIYYLVMEYLEGETLAERLTKGPLPIEQALRYSVEIADALDKAHRNGITHRDLKPGNIMLTKSGAKLLDFGLAKLRQDAMPSVSASQLQTMHTTLTDAGIIVGTVQYMAPEQVEARDADARTDIFAFGLLLFEMLSGRKPFEGKTSASVMAKILESEPPAVSSYRPMTPLELERIVKTCLAKDPDERWQSAGDLKRELKWIEANGSHRDPSSIPSLPTAGTAAPISKRERRFWLALCTALFVTAAIVAAIHFTQKPPAGPPSLQFQVRLPDKVSFTRTSSLELSPDGRSVAFAAVGIDNAVHLWVQSLDGQPARALANTDIGPNVPPPFWSPDSRFLVYSGFNKIRKVEVSTGVVEDLCDKPAPMVGGSWNSEGVIIIGSNNTGLWKTMAAGGKPVPLTVLDASWHEREHELPQFLPDGRHFLYLRVSEQPERTGIYVGSLDDPPERQSKQRILDTQFGVRFLPTPDGKGGRLLSFRNGTVTAQDFDPDKLQLHGQPVIVVERVGAAYETPQFAVSPTLIVYRPMPPAAPYQLTWIDDEGKRGEAIGDLRQDILLPVLSPDETKVAYSRISGTTSNRDIWLLDLMRGVNMRFTLGKGDNLFPAWSPDGREIIFSSNRDDGHFNLYRKPADGSEPEQLLLNTGKNMFATDWSTDGQSIVYVATDGSSLKSSLWMLPLKANANPIPLTSSGFSELAGRISADRRWLAYSSDETGRAEVYVREFPAAGTARTGGKWIVSRDGGYWPMWRKDGKELRFISGDQTTVMSVSVDSGRSFEAGVPRVVFRLPSERSRTELAGLANLAHSSDVKHLLVPLPVVQILPPAFTVLVNWAQNAKMGQVPNRRQE